MFRTTVRVPEVTVVPLAALPVRVRLLPSLWTIGRRLTAPAHDAQQNKCDQLGREEVEVIPSISLTARNWDHSSKMPGPVGMARSALPRPPSLALHLLAKQRHKPRKLPLRVTATGPPT